MLKDKIFPVVIIFFHIITLTAIQFIAWPEMISYPYLLNKGFFLYRDIINPYTPLLPIFLKYIYSFFQNDVFALKLVTYVIVMLSDLFIFLISIKIFKLKQAYLILSAYIFWNITLEGNGLWFDLAVTPLIVSCFYLLYLINFKNKYQYLYIIILGFILGLSFLIKQSSVVYFLVSIILLSSNFRKSFYTFLLFVCSYFLPLILSFTFFYIQGIASEYLFWAFIYPLMHIKSPGFSLLPTLKQTIISLILIAPVFSVFFVIQKNRLIRFIFLWFISSLIFVIPRFSYFHLQPSLPFITMLTIYGLSKFKNKKASIVIYFCVILMIFITYAKRNWGKEPRFFNSSTKAVSILLNSKLSEKQPLYFYNLSSEYIVSSNLTPVTPWSDNFPWYLEVAGLQERIISSIKKEQVNYIVVRRFNMEGVNIPGSYKPAKIDYFIENNFKISEGVNDDIWIMEKNN